MQKRVYLILKGLATTQWPLWIMTRDFHSMTAGVVNRDLRNKMACESFDFSFLCLLCKKFL